MKGNREQKNIGNYIIIAAALDWGLGHTTRCVPIFNEFIENGFDVIFAGTENQIKILKTEVPGATFRQLKGYNIHYNTQKYLFAFNIISQIPKIFVRIRQEKKWLKQCLKEFKGKNILVFSDNRPGFFNKNNYSIYLTHQTTVKTGNWLTSFIATAVHGFFIRKFNECWIPDNENHLFSGQLSEGGKNLKRKTFIGPLSRFVYSDQLNQYEIAIILSGPEPQRSILENIVLAQIRSEEKKIVVVRGLLGKTNSKPHLPSNITIYDSLLGRDLNLVLNSSALVICRSGYTSIMDLARVRAKAVLVPTPGQAEQEYLASYLAEKGYFMTVKQNNFSLSKILARAKNFPFKKFETDFDQFKKFIRVFAEKGW